MPYANREVQLKYLKDRRLRLRKGRPVNISQTPMNTNDEFMFKGLVPPLSIKPQKFSKPYDKQNSIEKEQLIKSMDNLKPQYIFV